MDENGFEYAKNKMEEPDDEANEVGRWIDDEVEEQKVRGQSPVATEVISTRPLDHLKVPDGEINKHIGNNSTKVILACQMKENLV